MRGLLFGIAFALAIVLVVQIAWNVSVSPLFGLPQATFPQIIGLLVFAFLFRFVASPARNE